ncbi:MAG: glycosyltransferase family 4 protein [Bacteroidetes bacterium]|nr:glycosyltransferase family 4 protein [Bacteroidota bacterium]
MKNILIYFYDVEIKSNSTNSVGRLVADVIQHLEKNHQVTFFTFHENYSDQKITTKPVTVKIGSTAKLKQKAINLFYSSKKIKSYHLKKQAVKETLLRLRNQYDFIIVPPLDEMGFLRKQFPKANIIYWIHNISAICKNEYLSLVNEANIFLSPSRTTYRLLLEKLQPRPLTAEFIFMPNWISDDFFQTDFEFFAQIKTKHHIKDDEIVLIFSGGDQVLKGKFILDKVLNKLQNSTTKKLVFIFAGEASPQPDKAFSENVRLISTGVLQANELAAYYHLAHFGCIPSLAYDHCPLVLLEMIHCHVLPIASDIGGIKEITGADFPCLISMPHEVNAWIQAIQSATALQERDRQDLLKPLQQKVCTIFSKQKALAILDEIFQS